MSLVHIYPEVRDNDGQWHAIVQDKSVKCPSCRRGTSTRKCRRCDGAEYIPKPFYHTNYDASSWLAMLTSTGIVHKPDGLVQIEGVSGNSLEWAILSRDYDSVLSSLRPKRGWNTSASLAIPVEPLLSYDWNLEQCISFWIDPPAYHKWRESGCHNVAPLPSSAPDAVPSRYSTREISMEEANSLRLPGGACLYHGPDGCPAHRCRLRIENFTFTPAQVCPKFMKALPLFQAVAPPERTRLVLIAYY